MVLYQNGIGYFERTGLLREDRLRLQFREREIDDVLKSLVVVEEGIGPHDKPSTVSARLPQADGKKPAPDAEDTTWLDLVLSPSTRRSVSIAYAVPTAAWKATYRIILPDQADKPSRGALLQAWALVDNVGDEDWSGVKLTLATGAPLSYVSNLRTPRFVHRPAASTGADELAVNGPIRSERTLGMDRDNDGIPDQLDTCPNEPGIDDPDAEKDGCPRAVKRVLVTSSDLQILKQVLFERDSDEIRAESLPIVDEVATLLKTHPEIHGLTIEGHSSAEERDPWGTGVRRAAGVRASLLAKGVTTELNVRSFGDTRPIAASSTDSDRKRNRRVEFRLAETRAGASGGASSGVVDAKTVAKTPAVSSAPRDIAGTVRYDITNVVSIPRRSSTLVTIINEYMPGEDILLYRPDASAPASSKYPFRAARIENKGNLGLQPGAVSLFAGGTFVGEGVLDKLNPGETALIPYAIDSSTEVRVAVEEAEQPVRILGLSRGVLIVENSGKITTRYEILPGRQAPSAIYVRHERRRGYETTRLPPKTETTAATHMIPVPIDGGKPSLLTVEEAEPRRQELAIFGTDGNRLALYLAGSSFPPELDKQVRNLILLRTDLGNLEQEIESLRGQLSDTAQRSAELRESVRAIEKTPRAAALQQRLLERLTEATGRAEQLSAKLADRSAAQAEARARLTETLRDLRIDEKPLQR